VHHGVEICLGGCGQALGLRAIDAGVVDHGVEGVAVDLPGQGRRAHGAGQVQAQGLGAQGLQARQASLVPRGGHHLGTRGLVLAHQLQADAA
jgi:hypothetical protein